MCSRNLAESAQLRRFTNINFRFFSINRLCTSHDPTHSHGVLCWVSYGTGAGMVRTGGALNEYEADVESSGTRSWGAMEVRDVEPRLVLVFSGKRKSGKDYVTDWIQKRLGPEVCCVLRLSGPLKEQYAEEHGLDLDQLLGPGPYKEQYRSDMILWGETRRNRDPGFFCRLATRGAQQPVWVVSDARRLSDLQWFQSEFPKQTQSVRVQSSDPTRTQRGWSFTAGVDDAESECGLDSCVEFDWIVTNESDAVSLEEQLQPMLTLAAEASSSSSSSSSSGIHSC